MLQWECFELYLVLFISIKTAFFYFEHFNCLFVDLFFSLRNFNYKIMYFLNCASSKTCIIFCDFKTNRKSIFKYLKIRKVLTIQNVLIFSIFLYVGLKIFFIVFLRLWDQINVFNCKMYDIKNLKYLFHMNILMKERRRGMFNL